MILRTLTIVFPNEREEPETPILLAVETGHQKAGQLSGEDFGGCGADDRWQVLYNGPGKQYG